MENERKFTNAVESEKLGNPRQYLSEKTLPALFSFFLIVLILSPIIENWRTKPTDSFPLSYYPMFTTKRGATETVTHLVGLDESGNRYLIPHRFAGTGGMNQVRKQISKSARNADAPQFCQTIAEKVALRSGERYGKIVKVLILSGEYNLNDYFAGAKNPVAEKIHIECPVQRNAVSMATIGGKNSNALALTETEAKNE